METEVKFHDLLCDTLVRHQLVKNTK